MQCFPRAVDELELLLELLQALSKRVLTLAKTFQRQNSCRIVPLASANSYIYVHCKIGRK